VIIAGATQEQVTHVANQVGNEGVKLILIVIGSLTGLIACIVCVKLSLREIRKVTAQAAARQAREEAFFARRQSERATGEVSAPSKATSTPPLLNGKPVGGGGFLDYNPVTESIGWNSNGESPI
jgi:hypothetical protein